MVVDDAEVLRGSTWTRSVPAETQTGKVRRTRRWLGAQRRRAPRGGRAPHASRPGRTARAGRRRDSAQPHRHARQLALDRRRQDLDHDRRVLRLHQRGRAESSRPDGDRRRARVPRLPVDRTGSVVASVDCCSRLSGPTTSTVAGQRLPAPMTKPGAGSPSSAGTTGTVRVAGLLELERERARQSPAPPRRRTARALLRCAGGTAGEPGRAGREIEHRDDVAGLAAGRAAPTTRAAGRPRCRADRRRSRAPAGCCGTPAARAGCARRRARPATVSHRSAGQASASNLRPR